MAESASASPDIEPQQHSYRETEDGAVEQGFASTNAVDATTSNSPSTAPTQAAEPYQPKTLGGFIVDDDEDEDDIERGNDDNDDFEEEEEEVNQNVLVTPQNAQGLDPHQSEALLNVDSSTPLRSLVNSPNNAVSRDTPLRSPSMNPNLPDSRPTSVAPVTLIPPAIFGENSNGQTGSAPFLNNMSASRASETRSPFNPSDAATSGFNVQSHTEQDSSYSPPQADPAARLPTDRIGLLEDRVSRDPKGDTEAWLSLIAELKRRNKPDLVRKTYDGLLELLPSAADQWVSYAKWELENEMPFNAEQIFKASLFKVPHLALWQTYLDYVRRRNNLNTDATGEARRIVSQCFDLVLSKLGFDRDAGSMWQDYIHFIKSGPGQVGGTGWQDQQKVDLLRKTYQQAVCLPNSATTTLWKEYDAFEMGLNKMTGRKILQERSPSYITARAAWVQLSNLTKDLDPTTLAKLPPAMGFDGDIEYAKQVEIWHEWIEWEKRDPLVIMTEDVNAYRGRVLHAYKRALIPLRFWPELWYDAAEYCFENGLEEEGDNFLRDGSLANPESALLAFRRADRLESKSISGDDFESLRQRGDLVREPYDKLLDSLYALSRSTRQRESNAISMLESESLPASSSILRSDEDDDQADLEAERKAQKDARLLQIEAIKAGYAAQIELLTRSISSAWIALMRAMRRIQGKGGRAGASDSVGGMRQVFGDARKRGSLTSDVYVESALMEHHCYKDPAALRIFERGFKLFKEDEKFILEYLKHLIAINDITNARATFETAVSKLNKPETIHKAKPLYVFFHSFESSYGELSQTRSLESRMAQLYPEDPKLKLFSSRFVMGGFDATAIRLIISPAAQARPRPLLVPEKIVSLPDSPQITLSIPQQTTNSPKRPLEDSDNEGPARKLARGDSPLKGAAGRRLNAAKQNTQLRNELTATGGSSIPMSTLPSLPPNVNFLLSIIPRADLYDATIFDPEKMVELIRNADLSKANVEQPSFTIPSQPPASASVPPYNFPPVPMNFMR